MSALDKRLRAARIALHLRFEQPTREALVVVTDERVALPTVGGGDLALVGHALEWEPGYACTMPGRDSG
ncbi:MAG: hypothetical protein WAL63_08270 [Solirubrobacteraceae bacterium]